MTYVLARVYYILLVLDISVGSGSSIAHSSIMAHSIHYRQSKMIWLLFKCSSYCPLYLQQYNSQWADKARISPTSSGYHQSTLSTQHPKLPPPCYFTQSAAGMHTAYILSKEWHLSRLCSWVANSKQGISIRLAYSLGLSLTCSSFMLHAIQRWVWYWKCLRRIKVEKCPAVSHSLEAPFFLA